MKKTIVLLLMILLCTGWTNGYGEDFILAAKTLKAPVIDGQLEDAAWETATPVTMFYNNRSGKKAKARTEARLLYDQNAIYVGVKAYMAPDCKYICNDNNLYAGENIEIMIDPGASRNVYFHFITNPNAMKYDAMRDQGGFVGDSKWEAFWTVAVHKTPEYWSCEFRIPYSSLEFSSVPGSDWAVNVARGARGFADGTQEDSAIAADGAYHIAGKFPLWKGIDIDFNPYVWDLNPPEVSVSSIDKQIQLNTAVTVANRSTVKNKVKIFADFFAPDGKVAGKSITQEFSPGSTQTMHFDGYRFDTPGDFRCEITISDFVTKRNLKRKSYKIPVAFNPLSIDLIDPHYKNAIFATQKLENVHYKLKFSVPENQISSRQIHSGIRRIAGEVLHEFTGDSARREFTFPAAVLPEGKMEIFAKILDSNGETIAETTHPLRKLPYLKGEVYLAKHRNLIVDGKPFFMIGQWAAKEDFIEGVNAFVNWTPYLGTKIISPLFTHNKFIRKFKKNPAMTSEEETEIRRLIAAEMNKEELFAYYLSDEPEVFGDNVEALNKLYKIVTDVDPYHPVIISNDTINGMVDFANAADINPLHPYPRPDRQKSMNDFDKVVRFLDAYNKLFDGRKQQQTLVWLAQGFDYSNYAAVNTRIPRYLELRNQHLLSLIAGGRGVLLYNRFNDHYPEIGIGLTEHVKELKAYAPVLLTPEISLDLNFSLEDFRWTARRHNGELWLFVASISHAENRRLSISNPEFGGGKFKVMAEGRTIQAVNGVLTDHFGNFDVRVYTTDVNKRLYLSSKQGLNCSCYCVLVLRITRTNQNGEYLRISETFPFWENGGFRLL